MNDSDANQGSSNAAASGESADVSLAGNPELSPLEGGQWRPVQPDELLKKPVAKESDSQAAASDRPKVQLKRRQTLEQKLKGNPTDLDGFLELAAIYRTEQRPLEAKRLLKQAIGVFPDNETVRWELEEAILARSHQQLREVSDLAAKLNSPESDRELERSRSDWACRRIEVCQARLERDPSKLPFRLALAEAKFDAELFEASREDAAQLLDVDEFAPQANYIIARCYLAEGNDLAAMAALRAVALRRAVVAPLALKLVSLRLLCDLSEKMDLGATRTQYQELLKRAEAAAAQSSNNEA